MANQTQTFTITPEPEDGGLVGDTLGRFRNTGRTTRMITAALDKTIQLLGKNRLQQPGVVIVFGTKQQEDAGKLIMQKVIGSHQDYLNIYPGALPITTTGNEYLANHSSAMMALYAFHDHTFYEDKYPGVLENYHKWDPPTTPFRPGQCQLKVSELQFSDL